MGMYYVYVLYSLKSRRKYIGFTEDLRQRIRQHTDGRGSIYTSKNRPFKLVYYEAFLDKKDAQKQERFLKSGYGREILKEKIVNSIESVAAVVQR